jgi:hypothetical protein
MTNQERANWLNEMNQHIAFDGKLTYQGKVTGQVPDWYSFPNEWGIVPLTRKAVIRVAYKWNSDGEFEYTIARSGIKYGGDFKMAEIEVSDEQ